MIKDVAKRAGVSVSTVSHALSGKRPVSEETRTRIFQAVDELNYNPSVYAQSLVTGRTHHIGLLFPLETSGDGGGNLNPIQLEMIVEANAVLQENGYGLQLYTQDGGVNLRNICRLCDGVLLASVRLQDERIDFLKRANFPFVMVGRPVQDANVSWVDTDFEAMVYTQIDHLYGLGHRNIVFLDRPERLFQQHFGYSVRARQGYLSACAERGIEPIIATSEVSIEAGRLTMHAVLNTNPELTALIAFNDAAVIGAYYALPERGLKIPDDFSIITFTSPGFLQSTIPTMTAMNNTGPLVIRTAAQLLLARLNEERSTADHILIQSQLLLGTTTASPAKKYS